MAVTVLFADSQVSSSVAGISPTVTLWLNGVFGSAAVTGIPATALTAFGAYSFSTTVAIGVYRVDLLSTTGATVSIGWVRITAETGTYTVFSTLEGSLFSFDGNFNVITNNYFTITPAQAAAALVPGQIAIVRGDTLTQTLTVGNLTGRSKLWLTMKRAELTETTTNTDSQSTIQIIEGTGLVVLNGSSTGLTVANASIVVTDATTGTIDLTITGSTTAVLAIQDLVYDVQALYSAGPTTQATGTVSITSDVTQAVS